MRHWANLRRKAETFQVGDLVLLSTQNLKLKHPGTRKLLPKWLGPFPIQTKINPVAFRLELPSTLGRLHPVFHVSLLRRYIQGRSVRPPPPPPVLLDDELEYEVEALLQKTVVRRGRTSQPYYLVKWKGYDMAHNSWEPLKNLTHCEEELQRFALQAQQDPSLIRSAKDVFSRPSRAT